MTPEFLNIDDILSFTMITVAKASQSNSITLDLNEVGRLFRLSAELADATEDILERQGAYFVIFQNFGSTLLQIFFPLPANNYFREQRESHLN